MTLKDMISNDIKNVFFKDDTEYSDRILISTNKENEKYIFASLQANEVQNNSGNSAPLIQYTHSLNAAFEDVYIYHITAGKTIYINNETYKVVSYTLEMGVIIAQLKKG